MWIRAVILPLKVSSAGRVFENQRVWFMREHSLGRLPCLSGT